MTTVIGSVALIQPQPSHKKAERDFKRQWQPSVAHDLTDACNHGLTQLVVTPESACFRTPNRSTYTIDLTANSREVKWLQELYRTHKPRNVKKITFGEQTETLMTEQGPENFWMLVIKISFT